MLPVVEGGNRCAQERKGGAEIETGESGATPDALSSGKVCAQNVTSVYRVTGVLGGGGDISDQCNNTSTRKWLEMLC